MVRSFDVPGSNITTVRNSMLLYLSASDESGSQNMRMGEGCFISGIAILASSGLTLRSKKLSLTLIHVQ